MSSLIRLCQEETIPETSFAKRGPQALRHISPSRQFLDGHLASLHGAIDKDKESRNILDLAVNIFENLLYHKRGDKVVITTLTNLQIILFFFRKKMKIGNKKTERSNLRVDLFIAIR